MQGGLHSFDNIQVVPHDNQTWTEEHSRARERSRSALMIMDAIETTASGRGCAFRSGDKQTDGIKETFFHMEARRMRRMLNGRVRRQDWLGYGFKAFQVMCVFSVVMREVSTRVADLRPFQMRLRAVPIFFSFVLILATICKTWQSPEHFFHVWLEAEVSVFTLWIMWEFDPEARSKRVKNQSTLNSMPFFQTGEEVLLICAVSAMGATLFLWGMYICFMRCVLRRFVHTGHESCWWQVREMPGEDAIRFTYLPHGPLSCRRRARFGYQGARDACGRPHGIGDWFDNSFHGECLHGCWVEGKPAGVFQSREYGTGALFSQRPIAYATSRSDCQPHDLDSLFSKPSKAENLRFGVAFVEVSLAGGFFPFLPRADRSFHSCHPSVDTMVEKMKNSNVEAYGAQKKEALVFIHGYNCSLATALGRVAQIFALGSMPSHIVPFVFSYGSGTVFSYFSVKEHFLEYASDFETFLKDLRRADFMDVHILCHSSGADFFFTNFVAASASLAPSRAVRPSESYKQLLEAIADEAKHQNAPTPSWGRRSESFGKDSSSFKEICGTRSTPLTRLHLKTLTLMNPDVLVEKVHELLPEVMNYAEHFTTYNDTHDFALQMSTLLQKTAYRWRNLRKGKAERVQLEMEAVQRHASNGLGTFEPPLLRASIGAVAKKTEPRYPPVVFGREVKPMTIIYGGRPGDRVCGLGLNHRRDQKDAPWLGGSFIPADAEWSDCIDVIDCSCIDQNVHNVRHNYYMLNTQMVEDVCELIGQQKFAKDRPRLVRVGQMTNVFHFMTPPSFLKE